MYFTAWIGKHNTTHRLCPLLEFWPRSLHFSAITHPLAPLAASFFTCCLPLPGDPLSLGHAPPRVLHGFPHPKSVLTGHILRRPDLPAETCGVLPAPVLLSLFHRAWQCAVMCTCCYCLAPWVTFTLSASQGGGGGSFCAWSRAVQ